MTHTTAAPCIPCDALDGNPARIATSAKPAKMSGRITTTLEGGDRPVAIFGGGMPVFNGEDGAIGSSPSKANFLSSLQRSLVESGAAPAKLYGFSREQIPEWYRTELLPTADAPEGFPVDRSEAWDDYLDGVDMGTMRGGLLGLVLGAGGMLAALYFGGAMVSSPKPASAAKALPAKPATATSKHRQSHKASRSRKGR